MTKPDEITPAQRADALLKLLQDTGGERGSEPSVTKNPLTTSSTEQDTKPTETQWPDDVIPKLASSAYEKSEVDLEVDRLVDSVTILQAYQTWCGKMQPEASGRIESVMISCPKPDHPDANPSAWMNTEKGTWYCGACQQGGDKFDIAAYYFGFPVPGYKNSDFPNLRRQMAESLGLSIVRGHSGTEYPVAPDPAPVTPPGPTTSVTKLPTSPETPPTPTASTTEPTFSPSPEEYLATVTPIHPLESSEPEEDIKATLTIDWESFVPHHTFLRYWMEAVTIDDLPHEYYFWLGIQALGFACRTDAVLVDSPPVKANLNVCTYGSTGSGKSRAASPYMHLLREALPFEYDPYEPPDGVSILAVPGSAEALLDSLKYDILDKATNEKIAEGELMGLLRVEEFASFMARASRAGSSLKEIVIELFDVYEADITIRSRTSGTTRVRNPFTQILTTTQPKAIHAFLRRTDTESGFLNRWVFAPGFPRRDPIPYGGITPDLTNPIAALSSCRAWAKAGHRFTLEGDALDVWSEFFFEEIAPMKEWGATQESMMSRLDLTLKKIIIMLTINEELSNPTAEIVQMAIGLTRYLKATYTIVSGDINYTDNIACQERVLDVIAGYEDAYGKPPSRRDIMRGIGKRFETELVDRTMKVMLSMELIIEHAPSKSGSGRPTTRYSVGA